MVWWSGGGIAAALLVLIVGSFFVDEPLRRYMEARLNAQLRGYTVHLPELDFHPIGFSISLKRLAISQNAHPQPPVAQIPQLDASVHWKELLRARLVADFRFTEPKVHLNRMQLQQEAADPVPLRDKGWQAALESIYPLKINRLRILDGDVMYIDDDPKRPLHLTGLTLVADNIRNIHSPDHVYPSELHLQGIVFDSGTLRLDGHANFLAAPHAGIDADVRLDQVEIGYFKPILARLNLWVTEGVLSADGHVEYAPQTERVHLRKLTVRGVQLDYTHSAETAAAEKARAATVGRAAEELSRAPIAVVRIDDLHIAGSTVGYVDRSSDPAYRVFLANSDLVIKNLSNQDQDGPASVALTGQFMGSGDSTLQASVRPAQKDPNLDAALKVEGTPLRSMNDLLRRFGNFDVVKGMFSLYAELSVKDGEISGYLKPIFKDMQVYSSAQDAAKPLPHQLYEGAIGGLQTLLQNRRGEVATKVAISGRASDPETSTWEIVLGLVENAFVKAVTHGFESPGREAQP
ncbi:MAG: DUF748 domain-containing protein [Candidatus Binatia bacterium]